MNIVTREARAASVGYLLGSGYLWLARDLNGSIAAYSHKPFKLDDECWRVEEGESKEMWMWVDDGDLYNFVKWEDEEPVNIREWLEKEEKEMKMYSVKDGELECREVDADFFEKNTTLGGLLTPRELDQDDKIVTDGATIQVSTRNSGKSAILEKAKKIREALIDLNANSITTGTLNASNMWWNPLTGTVEFTNPTTSDKLALDQDDKIIPDDANTIKVAAENSGNSAFYDMAEKFREGLKAGIDYGYEPSVSIAADQLELDQDNLSESTLASLLRVPYPMATDGLVLAKTGWFIDSSTYDIDSKYPPIQITLDDLNNVQIHGKVCQELTETYEKKNADYGNSFENSLDKHGLIAGIVRMDDKMSRLISLNSKDEYQVMDESMRDTLMDLANYAIMCVMWLDA